VPLVLRQSELYVTACMAGIVIFLGLAALGVNAELASTFGMVVIAAVRLASIRWRIMLPVLQIGDR
jgi:uncharacterized membrane protein YeiH